MAGIINLAETHMSGEIVWGTRDCCTGACDIFQSLHGIDPMWPLRGLYETKYGAYREIKSRGGWLEMTTSLANTCGLVSGDGSFGEIGVTREGVANLAGGRALAISGGDLGWIIRTEMGYAIIKHQFIERSWSWQQ